MNIPVMIRHIQKGNVDLALEIIREHIPLSKTISLICHAPCEKGCRRKRHDDKVSIRNLEQYAAFNGKVDIPSPESQKGKKIAIVGSGPTGLSAAYYLCLKGYDCVIIEKESSPGGGLRSIEKSICSQEIINEEIEIIEKLGCEFRTNTKIDHLDLKSLGKLKRDFDAVVLATGGGDGKISEDFKEPDWVFVGGDALVELKQAIRGVADGKSISESIEHYFYPGNEKNDLINSRFGPLQERDMEQFLKLASDDDLIKPENSKKGFSKEEAIKEGKRCLHCDCGKPDNCKLRDWGSEYHVDQKHYREIEKDNKRAQIFIRNVDREIIFEPGKCIKCGICVRICADLAEKNGMTFSGRGYKTELQIPFGVPLSEGLGKAADECVIQCPTGALVKDKG